MTALKSYIHIFSTGDLKLECMDFFLFMKSYSSWWRE